MEQIIPSGRSVRTVNAPVYLATKITAFRSRGGDDYYGSKDFEDIIALVGGRVNLASECRSERADLRRFLREWAAEVLALPAHRDYFAGHVSRGGGDGRWKVVVERIRAIAELPSD
ncbi:MAG: hypothetical protein GXP62_00260 [Oligoflexia bacterium]|nr:hypothetical protein [Oligoflexia bacterium]